MAIDFIPPGNRLDGTAPCLQRIGSCRPQIVPDAAPGEFAALLREMRGRTGLSALLNTSLNLHGEPLARTPAESVSAFVRSGADALRLGPFLTVRDGGG